MRWKTVYSDLDFREVLVAVWLLDDEERRTSLLARGRDIQMGYFVNFAMNSPKDLVSAERRYAAQLLRPASRRESLAEVPAMRDVYEQLRAAGRA